MLATEDRDDIDENASLVTLDGLEGLRTDGHRCDDALTHVAALHTVTSIGDGLHLRHNDALRESAAHTVVTAIGASNIGRS